MSIINGYGKQIGVIVFGGGIFPREWAKDYAGCIVIWCSDHARIHEAPR